MNTTKYKMKIKVISGFEGECLFKEPFLKTVGNYCEKFGYEFIPELGKLGEVFHHPNGFWWGKQYLVKKYLKDCDWLLWIDYDCIAINFEKKIEDLFGDFDILLTKEEMPETGVMLFRNCKWTHDFIDLWCNWKDDKYKGLTSDWDNNNHEIFCRMSIFAPEALSRVRFVRDTEFTIKHTNFYTRTSETLFMHVPGSTISDKVKYMEEYSKRWSFKDDTYCSFINLDHRKDRLQHMTEQLSRIGLNAERTRGLLPSEVNEPESKLFVMQKRTPGAIGCHYSQVSVMRVAHKLGKSALVMEDDLVFCDDFNERIEIAQSFLNTREWDIFWLGGTYHVPAEWHKLVNGKHIHPDLQMCECKLGVDNEQTDNKHIRRTYGIWSTYAYIVNYKSIPKILELLDMNVYRSMGIDWLFILLQPQLNTFAFAPGMVKQYDNLSDIGINGNGSPAITKFSASANLGAHWFQERMIDFNPETYNWAEARKK